MNQLYLLTPDGQQPIAGTGAHLNVGRKRWDETISGLEDPALAHFCRDLIDDPDGRGLLEGIFANSPFLTDCLLAEMRFLRDLLTRGPETELGTILQRVRTLAVETDQQPLMLGPANRAATDRTVGGIMRS